MSLAIKDEIELPRMQSARLLREMRLYMGKMQGDMPDLLKDDIVLSTAVWSKFENDRGTMPDKLVADLVLATAKALQRHVTANT